MSNTRVVNIRKESCDVYIGRAGQGKDGYFGNPFRLEATMTRGGTLDRYRKYFYYRLSTKSSADESENCRARHWGVSASRILVMGTSSRNTWNAWRDVPMK